MTKLAPRSRTKTTGAAPESSLRAEVIPNPAHDRADLLLYIGKPGAVRISIYNMLGEMLESLPQMEVGESGDYSREPDLSQFRNGVYIVVVESGRDKTSARFTVIQP